MSETFTLTFHGTRGSRTVCGPEYIEFGGDTTCISAQINKRTIVFDAGSGIVKLGKAQFQSYFAGGAQGPMVTYLLHTHVHYDHLCGLPYYGPLYFNASTTYMYGPRNPLMPYQETIERFLHPPYHPVPTYEMNGEIHWNEVREPQALYFLKGQEAPVLLNPEHPSHKDKIPPEDQVEAVVRCLRGYNHPKCGVMFYRLEAFGRSVVIATDTEAFVLSDRRLVSFSQGADVLVHDAMYTEDTYTSPAVPTQGWGHSTIECALAVARRAQVKRLYMVHHDPNHTDQDLLKIEAQAKEKLPGASCARDGQTLDLLQEF